MAQINVAGRASAWAPKKLRELSVGLGFAFYGLIMFRFWLSALVLAALPASFSANTYAVPDTLPKGAIEFTAVAAELTQRFWKNRPDTDRKFYRTPKNDS